MYLLNYHVVLDVLQSGVQQTVTGFYCGDADKKQLCVTLVMQGEHFVVPKGAAAAFTAVKPDQTVVSHPCALNDGHIFYVPTAQTLAEEGTVHCQIIVYDTDRSVLFSPKFDLQVLPPLVGEPEAVSADEIAFLPISVLANLADADGFLTYQDQAVGNVELVQRYYDLPLGCTGQLAFVQVGDPTHPRGFYRFGTQWEHLNTEDHTHSNISVLQMLQAQSRFLCVDGQAVGGVLTVQNANLLPNDAPNGQMAYITTTHKLMRRYNGDWYLVYDGETAHTHANAAALGRVTSAVVDNSHTHANAAALAKWSEDANGNPLYDGHPVVSGDDDTLVPLSLGVTYDALSIRSDWQDVPVYVLDPTFEIALYDQNEDNGISLIETTDYLTGMPVPLLRVKLNGDIYACFPRAVAGINTDYNAGWVDNNENACNAPSLTGMQFHHLLVGNDDYDDLSDLPAKAQSALETLSRMVNVSSAAMGDIRIADGAVLRFFGSLEADRHYDYITGIPFTLSLPTPAFTGGAHSITVDLHCTRDNVAMTLPREKLLDGGVMPDTRRGYHTLTFDYIPTAGKWSVGCVNRIEPQYWDDIPDQVIPLDDCTWAQIKSIAQHGYVNNFGQWCIRRNNVEEVWFEIGDTKTIAMPNDETWTVQLWDFMHDDLADGSGKAPFTFGMTGVTADTYRINTYNTKNGGWEQCYFRTQTIPTILSAMPQALQSVLASVTKTSTISMTANSNDARINADTTDQLFLPTTRELGDTARYDGGEKYAIFHTQAPGVGTIYAMRSINYHRTRGAVWSACAANGSLDPANDNAYLNVNGAPDVSAPVNMRLAFCV